MLRHLHLTNVGPAPEMRAELAPRLNLITGDNGLGKSFLLDIAWWSLTRTWPAKINSRLVSGLMARPRGPGPAMIEFGFDGVATVTSYVSEFDRKRQAWTGRPGRPANPGLVIYAQVDGSFSLWDPARNYWWTSGDVDVSERRPAYVFSPREVWEGLRADDGAQLCNGLLVDWAMWQKEGGEAFEWLKDVLAELSPPGDKLRPGALVRLGLDDVRDIPTIHMPYGIDVPVLHASAGIRRILALSYLLVWSWQEHARASAQLDQRSAHQVIFLIDEIEAHLHPKWQRRIVDNLAAAFPKCQFIATTHSPQVIGELDHERIQIMSEGEVYSPAYSFGVDSSRILAEIMDAPPRATEAAELLADLSRAVADDKLDRAQEVVDELADLLGEDDPEVTRAKTLLGFMGEG